MSRVVTVVGATTVVAAMDVDEELVVTSIVVGAGAEDRPLLGSLEQDPSRATTAKRQLAAGKAVLRSVMPAM